MLCDGGPLPSIISCAARESSQLLWRSRETPTGNPEPIPRQHRPSTVSNRMQWLSPFASPEMGWEQSNVNRYNVGIVVLSDSRFVLWRLQSAGSKKQLCVFHGFELISTNFNYALHPWNVDIQRHVYISWCLAKWTKTSIYMKNLKYLVCPIWGWFLRISKFWISNLDLVTRWTISITSLKFRIIQY